MAQLESGTDDPDWNSRLNTVVDLDQCRTVCTTWDAEEEIEYGLHIALSSIRQLNPVAVQTETRKSFDSNGDPTEETEIVSMGELWVMPEDSIDSESEDTFESFASCRPESDFLSSFEDIVGSFNSYLPDVFAEEDIGSEFFEINPDMTVTFTLSTDDVIQIIDPENELDRVEAIDMLTEVATSECIDSRITVPDEYSNGDMPHKFQIERDLSIGFNPENHLFTPEVILEAINDIHNGVLNNKHKVAITYSLVNYHDMTQAELARRMGVNPSVVSNQISDAENEIERAHHSANKYDAH